MGAAQDSHKPDSPAPAPKIDDGGPAYPCHTDMVDIRKDGNKVIPVLHGGMTLRDYFAAHALQGLLSDATTKGTSPEFARGAYGLADAMLAARKGGVA